MRTLSWLRRAATRLKRDRLNDEMQEEIRDHIARRQQQLIDDGMEPGEAAREARRRFGNVTRIREDLHDGWGFPRLESVLQDVRYGARLLRRAPGFTAVAVASLALGLGAAATVFTLADAVLFRPLPVGDPGSLRSFRASAGAIAGLRKVVFGAAPAEVEAMRREVDFAELAAFRTLDEIPLSTAGGEARPVRAELVSAAYFGVMRVAPIAGRLLDSSDRNAAPLPLVVSERLWRGSMGSAAAAVGSSVTINGTPSIVVGVVGGFRGLTAERPADVFAPLEATAAIEPSAGSTMARIVMRLRPGIDTSIAEARMASIYQSLGPALARGGPLEVTLPDASRGVSDAREDLRRPIGLGLVLVGVLMIVACANTGGLLVARFAARHTEFGVRIAIGAGRARLVRQLMVEALLLAFLAGGAALAIAHSAGPLLAAVIPATSTPVSFDVRFDWRLVAFTMLLSLLAAAGAGLMSLRQLMRTDTATALNAGSRSVVRGRRWSMEALVASQVGCSLLLLVVTVGMGRTLINLRHVDPGFEPGGAVAITVNASGLTRPASDFPTYFSTLYDRVASMPQVERVTLSQMGLLTRGMTTGTVDVPGRTPASDEERAVRLFFVGPAFFETLGMRIIAGESLGPAAIAGRERVVVVTQEFARFFFGSAENALGRFVNRDQRIVGVAADARYNTFRDAPARGMFVPFTQAPPRATMTFIIRAAGDPHAATTAVAEAIRAHDPVLKVTATTMAALVDTAMGRERFAALVAGTLAVLALVLSCAGVYATVAFAVSERRRELAVRFALGASGRDIARLVVRGPMRLALIGVLAAVPGAYVLMRATSSLLFGVSPFEPAVVAECALGLMAVAALAAALPAWRAAAIDPQECLRAN